MKKNPELSLNKGISPFPDTDLDTSLAKFMWKSKKNMIKLNSYHVIIKCLNAGSVI